MIEAKDHTLDPKEVSQLIKDGVELDDSGNHMYVMRFGWNNEMNKAIDPVPFQVPKHLNEKLRLDALGMPYVVPPYGQKTHLRKREGDEDPLTVEQQLEAILKVQSDYAIGEIQGSLEFDTGNVWLIIDIWQEFQAGVERGYYPPLVSPTFNFTKPLVDGVVEEAQFLNLQGVPHSGYTSEYTQIQPICKNNIKECMAEMVIHGSAGTLEAARKDGVSFSLPKKQNSQSMEDQEIQAIVDKVIPAVTEKIEEAVVKPLEEVKAEVTEIKKMEAANAEVLKEVATKTEGVDESKVVTDGTAKDTPAADPPADPTISGAAGLKQSFEKQIGEVKGDLKKYAKIAEEAEAKLRLVQATSIVERIFRNEKLNDADRETKIKEYVEMKDGEGNLKDLEFLDNTLKAAIPEASKESTIAGAYGLYKPDTNTSGNKDRPKNSEMFS